MYMLGTLQLYTTALDWYIGVVFPIIPTEFPLTMCTDNYIHSCGIAFGYISDQCEVSPPLL